MASLSAVELVSCSAAVWPFARAVTLRIWRRSLRCSQSWAEDWNLSEKLRSKVLPQGACQNDQQHVTYVTCVLAKEKPLAVAAPVFYFHECIP